MTVVAFNPLTDPPNELGYVTSDGMWAAIPWVKGKYVIIHNGQQVHTALSLDTAKSFIYKQTRKKTKL